MPSADTAPTTMRVVELAGTGGPDVLVPARRPVPHPAADQLLVRVRACGVCGHDLLARRGVLAATAGSVIGHEIAGEVVAVGSGVRDPGAWSGRRVALVQRIPCGACPDCTAGSTTHCRLGPGFYGEDLPGGYAEYVVASPLNAVPIPDDVDDATGSILSCGVGTGLRALRRAGTGPGDIVVVTGAGGGLGVHAVALARHLGATVVALTGSPAKEEPLLRLGAAAVLIAPDAARVRRRVAELGGRRGADVVLELTGAPAFAVALRSLAPGGRLVLVGNTEPALLPLDPGLAIVKELCVYGSAHADLSDLGDVVDLVGSGAITPMAARTWPLHEAALAHDAVERRQVAGRAVLVP